MRIQVTQNNIVYGVPSDPNACPVALAIQDAVGIEALVGSNAKMKSRKGDEVQPFTFDLEATP